MRRATSTTVVGETKAYAFNSPTYRYAISVEYVSSNKRSPPSWVFHVDIYDGSMNHVCMLYSKNKM